MSIDSSGSFLLTCNNQRKQRSQFFFYEGGSNVRFNMSSPYEYDASGNLLGQNDGCFARPTDRSPGSVCLIRRGKFIWISGDVEKRENGWTIAEDCKVE